MSSHEDPLSGPRKMATADKSAVDLELGVGGGGSENNRGPAVSAAKGEIVCMCENGRGSSAAVFSGGGSGSGVQETKIHLAKSERDYRIYHLSMDAANPEYGIPIELGCSCKEDSAAAHKQCAEAWFKIKGNK